MTYRLAFKPSALKEWNALDGAVKGQLKRKLEERLQEPRIASAKLRGGADRYKIKLRKAGYRLAYQVIDETVTVEVIAVGRRDEIYEDLD